MKKFFIAIALTFCIGTWLVSGAATETAAPAVGGSEALSHPATRNDPCVAPKREKRKSTDKVPAPASTSAPAVVKGK